MSKHHNGITICRYPKCHYYSVYEVRFQNRDIALCRMHRNIFNSLGFKQKELISSELKHKQKKM